jgi:squalene-hopene/tetraprenyl-beta-curcumene cyclase
LKSVIILFGLRGKSGTLFAMDKLRETYETLRERVLALRDGATGVWTGELSSSALGTALAISALDPCDGADQARAEAGAAWLIEHVNADGGWGDTPESVSNLSTTLIAVSALQRVGERASGVGRRASLVASTLQRAEGWITACAGSMEPRAITQALGKVYGEDRTFAAPILAYLAMCGEDERAWLNVPPLPFLLALLPQGLYRFFRLQVVSYALPALIAIGLCRHVCAARTRGRLAWGRWFAGPLLRRLVALQPEHGGFLDAIPLTAFVVLAMRHAGYGDHLVARKGLAFLRQAARRDGSWAIDSNLRTWVTSLAARAVWCGSAPAKQETAGWKLDAGGIDDAQRVAKWLVKAQLKVRHPFTGAGPGGWAWTDLPGGVPDADDTSGALLALRRLKDVGGKTDISGTVRGGLRWLIELQNTDGGMPTFCRGWGGGCRSTGAAQIFRRMRWRRWRLGATCRRSLQRPWSG